MQTTPLLSNSRRRITAPAVEPITLQMAKDHLLVKHSQDDTLITLWIAAARWHAERLRGEYFITQQWEFGFPRFPFFAYETLPVPAKLAQSVDAITYIDTAGETQPFGTLEGSPLTPAEYTFVQDPARPRVVLKVNNVWPRPARVYNAVAVTVTMGYGDAAEDVPELIRAGMLLIIGHFNENRETVAVGPGLTAVKIPLGIEDLLANPRAV